MAQCCSAYTHTHTFRLTDRASDDQSIFFHPSKLRLTASWEATEIMSPELVKLFRHNSFEPVRAFYQKMSLPVNFVCVRERKCVSCITVAVHRCKRLKLVSIIRKKDVLGFILDLVGVPCIKKRVFYSKIAFDTWRIAKKALTHLYMRHSFMLFCSLSLSTFFCMSNTHKWASFTVHFLTRAHTYFFLLLSCAVCACGKSRALA